MTNEKAVAEKLLQINAIKLNTGSPFTWASGWKSPIYCDNRKVLSYPYTRDFIKSEMCNMLFERFPNAQLLAGVATAGIAWGALGAAIDCYESALKYSLQREQFGKPIASFQLQQKKLAEMITEITKAQLMVWRLGMLKNEGKATSAQISMAKRNSCEIAANIARDARQMLGGMGITGEYSIMRHMMNLESVITYEGTHDIHLLITGMDVTGFNAFK